MFEAKFVATKENRTAEEFSLMSEQLWCSFQILVWLLSNIFCVDFFYFIQQYMFQNCFSEFGGKTIDSFWVKTKRNYFTKNGNRHKILLNTVSVFSQKTNDTQSWRLITYNLWGSNAQAYWKEKEIIFKVILKILRWKMDVEKTSIFYVKIISLVARTMYDIY